MAESKKEKAERIRQIKEQFRAVRAARRREEIEDHGKPFTSKNLPELKNKYKRCRDKRLRDEY